MADKTEEKIYTALVDACLSRCDVISVWDGEEWNDATNDRAKLLAWFGQVDDMSIRMHKDGQPIGQFYLILGNGEDLIWDHWDNDLCWEIANALSDDQ